MWNIWSLYHTPWLSVDRETGEFEELNFRASVWKGKYIVPAYTQSIIDAVRLVTAPLWERVVCDITGGKRVKRGNNKGYDIILPSGNNLEAKIGRIGNATVIKRNQLDCLREDDYYWLVFYRTTENRVPSWFIAEKRDIEDGKIHLRKNISLQATFFIPKPLMVHYYNTSDLVEGIISTTGIHHKPLCYTQAMGIFESAEKEYKRGQKEWQKWKDTIDIYTLWPIPLQI